MTVTAKWTTPEAIASALTTELNSLTDGSVCTASAAIDNLTDLYQYIELELHLASLTPTGSPTIGILLLKQIDGSNYEDANEANLGCFLTAFAFSTSTAAKHLVLGNLVIPPCAFKLAAVSHAGVTLASSANTLKYRRYNLQGV